MTMEYLSTTVTLTAAVTGYAAGDYAVFYANAGAGAIDYATEISSHFGLLGETTIPFAYAVEIPGSWQFGVKAHDEYDNPSAAEEASLYVDVEPQPPAAMTVASYTSSTFTTVLTLT